MSATPPNCAPRSRPGRLLLLALAALVVAGALALPRVGLLAPTQRPPGRSSSVRVVVKVAGWGLRVPKGKRATVQGTLTRAQVRALRHRRYRTAVRLGRAADARRSRALHALRAGAPRGAGAGIMRRLAALGARIESGSPLAGTLIVRVPAARLAALRHTRGVASVAPAPARPRPLWRGVVDATGASALWAQGHCGGGFIGGMCPDNGAATTPAPVRSTDTVPARFADTWEDPDITHPAFAARPGLFELPPPLYGGRTPAVHVFHGTVVVGAVAQQTVRSCPASYSCHDYDLDPTQSGVGYGISRVLVPDMVSWNRSSDPAFGWGAVDDQGWALGVTQDPGLGHVLPGAAAPAQIFNQSFGMNADGTDDNIYTQLNDLYADHYGVVWTQSAGNEGPAVGSLSSMGSLYNGIAVGGLDQYSADHAGDHVADWSSRGPSAAGRKKPDLVAPGTGEAANSDWRAAGNIRGLWTPVTGTSYASPVVAGVAGLLIGAGVTDPLAVKALLIDSARQGRSTPTATMGTQAGWQPDWGWGEVDGAAALAQRSGIDTTTIKNGGVRFYRATVGAKDRATITWNRHVDDPVPYCDAQLYNKPALTCFQPDHALSNLDLRQYAYDPTGQNASTQASSTSTIDNVEQVRAPAAGQVVYKVNAASMDGRASERYAIAATRTLTPLAAPVPQVTLSATRSRLTAGQDATVTATIRNPSPDLPADAVQLNIHAPAGLNVDGPAIRPVGTLAAGASTQVTFAVRASGDSPGPLTAAAQGQAYGSTLTSDPASVPLAADLTPPAVSVQAPSGQSTDTALPYAWGASDPGSGIAGYDTEMSVDGGPYQPWLTATTQTSGVYQGQTGHSYRLRVRATDRSGNASGWLGGPEVRLVAPDTGAANNGSGGRGSRPSTPAWPTTPSSPTPARNPRLAVVALRNGSSGLLVRGRAARGARGQVTLGYRCAQRRATGRARLHGGSWRWHARLPADCRRARNVTLTVRYAGGRGWRAQRIVLRLHGRPAGAWTWRTHA